jgi:membrane protease YdiL (CAAX protease family)
MLGLPLLWAVTALANGTLEEVLWRGVFAKLFPRSILWGVLWPAGWFAIWHLAPGTLSMADRVGILVVGATGLGVTMSWVAQRSQSIRWTALSHALASIIQA